MSSSYQELVEPIRLEQCIKRRQQDRIAELEAQRDELLKIVKEGLDECWYSLAKERVDSIVAEVEARLADRPERCPDCEGSGSLGQARDGREIACELCDGDEEALGTGRLPSSNERRIEELETQLAAEKQDAAVGKALREMKAHVHVLDLFQPLPSDVINTDCFEVMVTDKNRFLESYTGTTPYAAFVNAGLIPDGVKETK